VSEDALDGVQLERRDGIATITLDAPDRRNAIDHAMARSLLRACAVIDDDPDIGAVVVRGAGGYFCSGGDRGMLAAAGRGPAAPDAYATMTDVYESFRRVGELAAPTIAAVRGGAVGAGLNLALATDLRIVARDAVLMSGFLRIGLHPGGGNNLLLTRAAGQEAAAALNLFGAQVRGERAVELGLAWETLDDEQVEARAYELAAVPASDPELARRSARSLRLITDTRSHSWNVALEFERASQMWSMARKDARSREVR
jgi:enoyl-CoA hydratase